MLPGFDAYHKWLGIPPDQRPPTHYQLLGISPGEVDVEVIESAAVRQMAYVRNFQIGEHAEVCRGILEELVMARATLIDPAKRRNYDARIGVGSMKSSAEPLGTNQVAASRRKTDAMRKKDSIALVPESPSTKPIPPQTHMNSRRTAPRITVSSLIAIGLCVVAALVVYLDPTRRSETTQKPQSATGTDRHDEGHRPDSQTKAATDKASAKKIVVAGSNAGKRDTASSIRRDEGAMSGTSSGQRPTSDRDGSRKRLDGALKEGAAPTAKGPPAKANQTPTEPPIPVDPPAPAGWVPIYAINLGGRPYYTSNRAEVIGIVQRKAGRYDGILGYGLAQPAEGMKQLSRSYSILQKRYFYEFGEIKGRTDQPMGVWVFTEPRNGTVPVFRLEATNGEIWLHAAPESDRRQLEQPTNFTVRKTLFWVYQRQR